MQLYVAQNISTLFFYCYCSINLWLTKLLKRQLYFLAATDIIVTMAYQNKTKHKQTQKKPFTFVNIVLVFLVFSFLLAVRLYVNQPVTGDEPSYLLMDYSLVHDHDLNLRNNYLDKDYLSFYPHPGLLPQGNPKIINLKNPKVYSVHGFGLPLFLYTGFLIGAKNGAVLEMIMLATLVIVLTYIWTYQVTKTRIYSYIGALLLLICYFFNGVSGYIYPDMLIAALALGILIILNKYHRKIWAQVLLGFILGFLVWVHIKTLDIALPALVVDSYLLYKSDRKLPWITYGIFALFIAYYCYTLRKWFGVWNIQDTWGGQGLGSSTLTASPLNNIPAMLFDINRGLIIYQPVCLLLFVGLPIWFKKNKKTFFITALVIFPAILILSIYTQWYGGGAETGRQIDDFLPAIFPAVACAVMALKKPWQRIIVVALALLSLLITIDATLSRFGVIDPSIRIPKPQLFYQIEQHFHLNLSKYFLTYTNNTVLVSRYGPIKVILVFTLVIALVYYGYRLAYKKSPAV